jgi:ribosomal protein S26
MKVTNSKQKDYLDRQKALYCVGCNRRFNVFVVRSKEDYKLCKLCQTEKKVKGNNGDSL